MSWVARLFLKFAALLLIFIPAMVLVCVIAVYLDNFRHGWWITEAFCVVGIVGTILGTMIAAPILETKISNAIGSITGGKVNLDDPLKRNVEAGRANLIIGFYIALVFGLLNTATRIFAELAAHDWANLEIQGSIWLLVLGFVVATRRNVSDAIKIGLKSAKQARAARYGESNRSE